MDAILNAVKAPFDDSAAAETTPGAIAAVYVTIGGLIAWALS